MKKLFSLIAALLLCAPAFGVTTAYNMRWGSPYDIGPGAPSDGTATTSMGTTLAKAAGCLMVDIDAATVTIHSLGWKVGSVTGTPAGSSYKISVQGVTVATGAPDGTIKGTGGGTPASKSVTPAAATTGWIKYVLDNDYTANRGDLICIVGERTAATDASNKIELAFRAGVGGSGIFPYYATYDGATWTVGSSQASYAAPFAFYDTTNAVVGGFPFAQATGTVNFGATAEAGFSFTVPAAMCGTYTVKAVRWQGKAPAANASNTYLARLYTTPTGTPTTVQTSGQVPANATTVAATTEKGILVAFADASLTTLSGGVKYGIGFTTTASTDMNLALLSASAASDFNAWPYRQQTAEITRTTSGAYPTNDNATTFTETTTQRPVAEILLASCDGAAAGGGGGVY